MIFSSLLWYLIILSMYVLSVLLKMMNGLLSVNVFLTLELLMLMPKMMKSNCSELNGC